MADKKEPASFGFTLADGRRLKGTAHLKVDGLGSRRPGGFAKVYRRADGTHTLAAELGSVVIGVVSKETQPGWAWCGVVEEANK